MKIWIKLKKVRLQNAASWALLAIAHYCNWSAGRLNDSSLRHLVSALQLAQEPYRLGLKRNIRSRQNSFMALYKQGPLWKCDTCGMELYLPYTLHCGVDYCKHGPHRCGQT